MLEKKRKEMGGLVFWDKPSLAGAGAGLICALMAGNTAMAKMATKEKKKKDTLTISIQADKTLYLSSSSPSSNPSKPLRKLSLCVCVPLSPLFLPLWGLSFIPFIKGKGRKRRSHFWGIWKYMESWQTGWQPCLTEYLPFWACLAPPFHQWDMDTCTHDTWLHVLGNYWVWSRWCYVSEVDWIEVTYCSRSCFLNFRGGWRTCERSVPFTLVRSFWAGPFWLLGSIFSSGSSQLDWKRVGPGQLICKIYIYMPLWEMLGRDEPWTILVRTQPIYISGQKITLGSRPFTVPA